MNKYILRPDGFREGYRCYDKRNSTSKHWAIRTVRKNLSVKIGGEIFFCPKNTDNPPIPGERILFGRYFIVNKYEPFINEWTAPADSDGFIRRMFWNIKGEKS